MLVILQMLLDYLNANNQLDDSALLEYKKKLDEEKNDKIKEQQVYKQMIGLLDLLLKSSIKNTNDIDNLKNIVQGMLIDEIVSTYDSTEPLNTLSDFLKEHSKSQNSLNQS